ncbi:MAG: SprT family zinc-dependent metalloprotease [Methylophilus sp.]|nr:SprT family zinc-dependent metalloprotease [Methylophilus sp.]
MVKQVLTLPSGEEISYWLEHRPRRTVGLKITNEGLMVHAPKRIFAFQLNQILQEKAHWITNKLALRTANQVEQIEWQHGEHLLYLGQDIVLEIQPSASNKQPQLDAMRLIFATSQGENADYLQHKIVQWYKKQAMQDFSRRLEIFAVKLGVPTPPLALSNAKMRWGSCNSRGEVRLNWRLVQAPSPIVNYVICHELAHLKEMNHSARFYAVLAHIFPDYKQAEKELKTLSSQLHRLG